MEDTQELDQTVTKIGQITSEDAAYGSVFGAFIGDAAGAFLEFQHRITDQDVQKALTFPGGGSMGVGKAQITDDSEMAMCILHGLTDQKYSKAQITDQTELPLNLDAIGTYFCRWSREAFDIGFTTRAAFSYAKKDKIGNLKEFYKNTPLIFQAVFQQNQESESNGCLMRITPLAVWGHKLQDDQLYQAVQLQTMLTHCNKTALLASYLYCYAIKQLIANPGDALNAYDKTKEEASKRDKENYGRTSVSTWFEEIESGIFPNAQNQIGWLKIAFTRAFQYLREYSTLYEEDQSTNYFRMTQTKILRLGGDTDTNAAIVGGLIGALIGKNNIPKDWVDKLLAFDCDEIQSGIPRNEYLIPKRILQNLLNKVYTQAPQQLTIQFCNELIDDQKHIKLLLIQANNIQNFLDYYRGILIKKKEEKDKQIAVQKQQEAAQISDKQEIIQEEQVRNGISQSDPIASQPLINEEAKTFETVEKLNAVISETPLEQASKDAKDEHKEQVQEDQMISESFQDEEKPKDYKL